VDTQKAHQNAEYVAVYMYITAANNYSIIIETATNVRQQKGPILALQSFA
jgi:hypothetical protein